jgi:TMEM175 potassium channel family protein
MNRKQDDHSRGAAESDEAEAGEDRSRFLAFSDGVFAFAATLLVVSLAAPVLQRGELSHLTSDLLALWPQALAYAISFLVVSSFWAAHRQLFRHISRLDDRVIVMNSVLLLLIAALPFPSSVLGLYSSAPVAVALYAATLTAIGLLLSGLRMYALSRNLFRHRASPQLERIDSLRSVSYPAVFAVSIPIAYAVSPNIAMYSWLLLIPLNMLLSRSRRRTRGAGR